LKWDVRFLVNYAFLADEMYGLTVRSCRVSAVDQCRRALNRYLVWHRRDSRGDAGVEIRLAEVDHVPVLIFDEIDTGWRRGRSHDWKRLRSWPVPSSLCITHLRRSLSSPDHLCRKVGGKGRTIATVRLLTGISAR